MLIIAIEDLLLHLGNLNLLSEKKRNKYEILTQKREISKKLADILYYKYHEKFVL